MATTALVLAAGASRRFGRDDKLLADAGGEPILARVVRALDVAPIGDVIVAVRPGADAVRRAVAGVRSVRFAVVDDAERGLSASLIAGLGMVADEADGLLVTPGDMPGLTAQTVERLLAAFAAHQGTRIAYAALPDGSQRNPVIWPRRLWPRLRALTGDVGGKHLIRAVEAAEGRGLAVPVADGAELADIDTPDELAAFLAGSRAACDRE